MFLFTKTEKFQITRIPCFLISWASPNSVKHPYSRKPGNNCTTGEFPSSLRIHPCDLSMSKCSRRGSTAGPGGCGPSTPAADSCAERATRCRGFHAPSLLCWFPLQPAEPLLGWINTGCSSTALPRALNSSAHFAARRLVPHKSCVVWSYLWVYIETSFCNLLLEGASHCPTPPNSLIVSKKMVNDGGGLVYPNKLSFLAWQAVYSCLPSHRKWNQSSQNAMSTTYKRIFISEHTETALLFWLYVFFATWMPVDSFAMSDRNYSYSALLFPIFHTLSFSLP